MAQVEVHSVTPPFLTPEFFVTLIAGVVLAFGFQLLLTSLSVALGLSLTPNLKTLAAKSKAASLTHNDAHFADDDTLHDDASHHAISITSGLGLWAMLTTSVALFLSTMLATHLSFSQGTSFGLVLGLVIWAAFFMIMTYLEIKTVTSVVGGLIHSALGGIRTSFVGAGKMLAGSPEKHMEQAARKTVRGMYEEVSKMMQDSDLDSKLQKYVAKLEPKLPDYDRIVKDFSNLIGQIELEERTVVHEDHVSHLLDLHLGQKNTTLTAKNAGKLRDAAKDAIQAARSKKEGSYSDQAFAVVDRMLPGDDEGIRQAREKMAQYLKDTGREELSPEKLQADLEHMLHDPKATVEVLKNRLGQFDRNTLHALIANHESMDDAKAEKVVSMLETALDYVNDKFASTQKSATQGSHDMQANAKNTMASSKAKIAALPAAAEGKLKAYFDGLGKTELNYDALKNDVLDIFQDPSHAPAVLKDRLGKMDRNSVNALLSGNPYISDEQAEAITERVLSARDTASGKLDAVTAEVNRRYEQIRLKAVIAAEHTRKNAIAASWWVLMTAAVSAAAAAAGGYIAVM